MARTCHNGVWPFTVMVATECTTVGLHTLFKAASMEGLNYYVFIVYIHAINIPLLLPLLFCSKTKLPPRIFPIFWRICLLGPICLIGMIFSFKGIQYTSPAMASSMTNLLPAFTFILAIIFRMEKLSLRSSSFQAKFLGTVLSMAGALVVILYKGPQVYSLHSSPPHHSLGLSMESAQSNWFVGGILLIGQALLFSFLHILVTDTMKIYPEKHVVSFFIILFAAILSIPVCLIAEPDMKAWAPSSRTAIITLIYSGFSGPAFVGVVTAWCLHLKGPVYVATFKPLSIIIAVIKGVIFLGDTLYLGSIIGALILSSGVYGVIWGKAKEESMKQESSSCIGNSSSAKTPLLKREETHQDV